MSWVGIDGFEILRPEPNPTRYQKKKFVTQPNSPSPKNRSNPTGWVGSGRFWRVGGLAAHPYPLLLQKKTYRRNRMNLMWSRGRNT